VVIALIDVTTEVKVKTSFLVIGCCCCCLMREKGEFKSNEGSGFGDFSTRVE